MQKDVTKTTTDEPLPSEETLDAVDVFLDTVEAAQLQKKVDCAWADQPHRTPDEVERRLEDAEITHLKNVLDASITAAFSAGISKEKVEDISKHVSDLTVKSGRALVAIFVLKAMVMERHIIKISAERDHALGLIFMHEHKVTNH